MKAFSLIIFLPFSYLLLELFQRDKALTQDLGRHIKLGEIITSCICVPKVNLFSYVETTHPFINHHWLSEVVFYALVQVGGLSLILFLKIILIFLSFGIVFYIATKKGSLFWASIVSVFYMSIFSERFDSRPEIFSFFYLSLFLLAIHFYRMRQNIRFLLVLPLLMLLWVNSHIYFVVGLIIFSAFLINEMLRKKFDKRIGIIGIVMILITLLNPNGFEGTLVPFTIFKEYGYSIVENQNIFFLNSALFNIRILIFEVVAVVFLVIFLSTIKKFSFYEIALVSFALISATVQIRNFPLFVLLTLPIASHGLLLLENKLKKSADSFSTSIKALAFVITICFVIIQTPSLLFSPVFGVSYWDTGKESIEFMKAHNLKGPIFNNFDIGSYVIYRLYPYEKVFVDGRPEAYSKKFFDDYKRMQEDPTFFESQVKKYNIQTIYFAYSDITPWGVSFVKHILKNPSWKTVYADATILILIKDIPENKSIIDNFSKNVTVL